MDFLLVFASCLGFENRGVVGGFDNEVTGNGTERSESDTDSSDESGVATASRNRRGKMIDYVNSARFA